MSFLLVQMVCRTAQTTSATGNPPPTRDPGERQGSGVILSVAFGDVSGAMDGLFGICSMLGCISGD